MAKAIFLTEMPNSCKECKWGDIYANGCYLAESDFIVTDGEDEYDIPKETLAEKRMDWCPLKPMPQKLDANDWHRMFGGTYVEREAKGYGWNACLTEIGK